MTSNASRDHSPSNHSLSTNDERQQSAAFRGASRAFSQPTAALKPFSRTYSGANGALAAASTAGTESLRREEVSVQGSSLYTQQPRQALVKASPDLGLMETRQAMRQSSQPREQSPSYTAARLATSKTTPTRDGGITRQNKSPLQRGIDGLDGTRATLPTNETPTTATNSLVRLFESKQDSATNASCTQSVRYVNKAIPGVASHLPIRSMERSVSATSQPRASPPVYVPQEDSNCSDTPHFSHARAPTATAHLAGPELIATESSPAIPRQVPKPPVPRRRTKRPSLDKHLGAGRTMSTSYLGGCLSVSPQTSTTDLTESFLNEAAASLRAQHRRREDTPPLPTRRSDSLLIPSRQASISTLPSRPALPSARSFDKSSQSPSPLRSSRPTTRSSDSYLPQLTVDSLANAMVASSLASSRAPSPSKPPPMPPPRRHGKSYSIFHHYHSQEQISRTPSPPKGMRYTMREPLKLDDEVDYRGKKGHIKRKHAHKHHEGDRKRYRNQVTERERKRYEGVWAANKGLLMASEAECENDVLNIVVRDIWSRSRLPDDVLEEIWDLVDTRGNGKLGKEGFVIGLWLVDSRLKGNKLPSMVSESMWASVRRLTGIKVPHHRR